MQERGVASIYLVVIILFGILAITAFLSYSMAGEIRMMGDIGLSDKAYQAADSGIEGALLAQKEGKTISDLGLTEDTMCSGGNPTWFPVDDCSYCLELQESNDKIIYFKSIGRCGQVRRSVEVSY